MAGWPDVMELEAILVSDGIVKQGEFPPATISRWRTNAIAYIEEYTHWNPIVSTGLSETRMFTPNGTQYLNLTSGLLTVTEFLAGTTPYTEDTDYWLMGESASGWPNHYVQFPYAMFGTPKSISITGTWGFISATANLPVNLLEAFYGVVELQALIAKTPNEGAVAEKEVRDQRIRFANYYTGPASSGKTKYDMVYENVVATLDHFTNPQLELG